MSLLRGQPVPRSQELPISFPASPVHTGKGNGGHCQSLTLGSAFLVQAEPTMSPGMEKPRQGWGSRDGRGCARGDNTRGHTGPAKSQFPSCHQRMGNAHKEKMVQMVQDQAHPCPGLLRPAWPRCSQGYRTQRSRPHIELPTYRKTQQIRCLHRSGIARAKQILQQLVPGSSAESSFGQRGGMQRTWLLHQKYFETVSNKFSRRDFTAENGGKRRWGMGTSVL